MSRILVGSTIPAFAMGTDDWGWWLKNAERIVQTGADAGHVVEVHAVLQRDGRGEQLFEPLYQRFEELIGFYCQRLTFPAEMSRPIGWTGPTLAVFSLDVGVDEWTSSNRLAGIVTGRNLIIDHALRNGHDFIYFCDADIEAPDDILVKLLELDYPVVGANVPAYCLKGPHALDDWRERIRNAGEHGDIQVHWSTAGSLLVRRDLFRRVPWRIDPDAGQTDDPATQAEMERLGYPTLVRHDVVCRHHPDAVTGFENRGLDRKVYR